MLHLLRSLPSPARLALLALAVCLAAGATVAGLVLGSGGRATARAAVMPTLSAAAFGEQFVGMANAYSRSHGGADRLANPHCVQASSGHYMCAYTIVRRGGSECHLMQALWTPGEASTITVTLAGRTSRCGSLREAVQSLRSGA